MTDLPAVLFALAMSAQAIETSLPVTVVHIGQLDKHFIDRMPKGYCGAFFTFARMDRDGGGMVVFGVRHDDLRKYDDDPTNDHELQGHVSGMIRLVRCEECSAPMVQTAVQGTRSWVNLFISEGQKDGSPCLRRLKFQK